jgi:hypothetical protein
MAGGSVGCSRFGCRRSPSLRGLWMSRAPTRRSRPAVHCTGWWIRHAPDRLVRMVAVRYSHAFGDAGHPKNRCVAEITLRITLPSSSFAHLVLCPRPDAPSAAEDPSPPSQ